ncbi:spondin domain-containing protein [Aurantibacter crassamenti]|uniref:spondin domain-containing protein n=1 Tax=Aurantibacter crassamenti TaxID=1837375 RepID=UPI00193AA369|nr:spondin domain-containing protein [Aurantibacter crassamenti]MBM1107079.1 spondin domain-containing protein [Aurantibacter crassamenti]
MKNFRTFRSLLVIAVIALLYSCDEDTPIETVAETQQVEPEAKTEPESVAEEEIAMETETMSFNITIKNVVQYLSATVFNMDNTATEPGPVPDAGCFFTIDLKAAAPGGRVSFATMSAASNDWFFAPKAEGIALFENGAPVTGDVTDQVYLWDAGVEKEDPATFTTAPDGATAGEPDPDNTVRIVTTDVAKFISVYLSYNEETMTFSLKIENVRGNKVETDPIIITPGIAVVHAQDNALFEPGFPDAGHGLAEIALRGNPTHIYEWLTATCDSGSPLRLSSSFTVLAPGIVYAFNDESDPVFTQGEQAMAGSGIEESAEDGNTSVMYDYITNTLALPAAQSNEMMPVGPGGSLTFTLEAPVGSKLGFNTMFVFSNDWFMATNNAGYHLFNGDGSPRTGTEITQQAYLYDAGTEYDQPVGLGMDQAPFQAGPNTGAADDNNSIRRVMEIDDVQFGKGSIQSYEGVVGHPDLRGGYNIVAISIEVN